MCGWIELETLNVSAGKNKKNSNFRAENGFTLSVKGKKKERVGEGKSGKRGAIGSVTKKRRCWGGGGGERNTVCRAFGGGKKKRGGGGGWEEPKKARLT